MKTVRLLAVLIAVQLGLVGLYLAVQWGRTAPQPFAAEVLDEPAPVLMVERSGDLVPLPDGPYLVHFWATWCGPCRLELPGLLQATEATGVPLLAVTDEPWPVVHAWFDGQAPPSVVRDGSAGAATAWRVSGLPDTFVVRAGRVVARMGGPRDWQTPEARDYLMALRRDP